MNTDEEQLDQFLQKAVEPPTQDKTPDPTSDDEIVAQKARASKAPTATSVLQNKTVLSETQLEARIAQTLRKYPNIDEGELRQQLSADLKVKGELTEADYVKTVDAFLAEDDQPMTPDAPTLSPPPFVANGISGAQQKVSQVADWASSLSTPGGVGMLIFALLFFIWVIVPVSNGQTRLQLLWGIITGQVGFRQDIQSAEDASGGSADFGNGGGASANFGGGSLPYTDTLSIISFEVD